MHQAPHKTVNRCRENILPGLRTQSIWFRWKRNFQLTLIKMLPWPCCHHESVQKISSGLWKDVNDESMFDQSPWRILINPRYTPSPYKAEQLQPYLGISSVNAWFSEGCSNRAVHTVSNRDQSLCCRNTKNSFPWETCCLAWFYFGHLSSPKLK